MKKAREVASRLLWLPSNTTKEKPFLRRADPVAFCTPPPQGGQVSFPINIKDHSSVGRNRGAGRLVGRHEKARVHMRKEKQAERSCHQPRSRKGVPPNHQKAREAFLKWPSKGGRKAVKKQNYRRTKLPGESFQLHPRLGRKQELLWRGSTRKNSSRERFLQGKRCFDSPETGKPLISGSDSGHHCST